MDVITRLTRIPRRPARSDVALTAGLGAWALLEAVLDKGPGGLPTRVALALVITLPLLMRRRFAFAVVVVLSGVSMLWALAATRPETGTMPFPCLLVAAFSVSVSARRNAVAIAGGGLLLAAMLTVVLSSFYPGSPTPGNIIILIFFLGGAWAAGWLVRRRSLQAHRALVQSGDLARAAVIEERARIARELHDVVAHSVSIIAVQAGAAEELIDRSPDLAREHLSAVRRTARETMSEMRLLLDVLRSDQPSYAPQPGLARLPDLLDEARGAGVAVELVEEGQRPHLAAGLDLVAFRVVQESLTNVRKHAFGAAAQVRVTYGNPSIEVDVSNAAGASPPAPAGPGGHGLVGMRERVRLFGGSIEAGPTADGGYRVHARLPVTEVAG